MALLMLPSGEQKIVRPTNGKRFMFNEARDLVSSNGNPCLLQRLKTIDNLWMYVDEEGLLKQLPYNARATTILHKKYIGQRIVGNALVLNKGEF